MSARGFSRYHRLAFAALVVVLAVSIDCTTPTPADPDAPSIGFVALPGMTITRGESDDATVTITRSDFFGPVTLTAEGLPSGVTVTFSNNPVTSTTSEMTVSVAESVTPNTYSFTLRATGSGVDEKTLNVQLIVEDFEPGFSLEPMATLSVQQGASGTRTVLITRDAGFVGEVTVTVTDVPSAMNAAVDPVVTTGNSVEVTIQVDGSASVGNYDLTVRGNAPGLPEDTENLRVQVTAATAQQITLDFRMCVAEQRPDWLAYRDGASPWVGIEQASSIYNFEVASPTVGVAIRTQLGGGSQVLVFHATTAELVSADVGALCDQSGGFKSVTATVAGIIPGEEGANVSLGDVSASAAEPGPISFFDVPDGNVDLVAYRWSLSVNESMILLRDLDPEPDGDIGTLDFNGASAFFPAFAMMTAEGGSGGDIQWFMEYATTPVPGTCYYAPLDGNTTSGKIFNVGGAPADRQQEGDFHVLTVTDGVFTASETFATMANRTITFGSPLPPPTVTDITGSAGYRRMRIELTLANEYDAEATLSLVDDVGARSIAVIATPGWLDGLDVSMEVPDLTGAAGWLDEWAPASQSTTNWVFSGYGWTGEDCTEGAREVGAVVSGTVG